MITVGKLITLLDRFPKDYMVTCPIINSRKPLSIIATIYERFDMDGEMEIAAIGNIQMGSIELDSGEVARTMHKLPLDLDINKFGRYIH